MGAGSSRDSEDRSWDYHGYSSREVPPYQNYPPPPPSYAYDPPPPASYSYDPPPPPAQSYPPPGSRPRMDRRFSRISDDYHTLEQVSEALAKAGLESSNLIVGIDFTKSNEWSGKFSFGGRSLHHIGNTPNPYEQAISIIGRTLSSFDEDNLIPCYGFGDASTHDQDVFSFYPNDRPCDGFQDALARYRELLPHLRLAGPTSFAPIIEMAMTIVEKSGGQYHVLVIIADGQVTRSVDTQSGHLSSQEQKTIDAIVKASGLPLSIILVGVGDGPWDMMKEFDDNIPTRAFDNFQFVNFTEIMSKNIPQTRKETTFALAALMEIPSQYKATLELGILGRQSGKSPQRVPLPPPTGSHNASSVDFNSYKSTSFQQSAPPPFPHYETTPNAPSAPSSSFETQVCPICLTNPRDLAFGCGHLVTIPDLFYLYLVIAEIIVLTSIRMKIGKLNFFCII
ncbi:hypothetical protein Cni_G12386 [Canna indica]|uniref:VWFA domain-containing protein n=1 Tax=Canna indica TaxID=4628 RepID=A0AAQ3Q8Z3_9LILI|nr:hypothetical protein Cni_G12386 [Canna indica]